MCYLALTTLLLLWGRERVYAGGFAAHVLVLATIAVATWHRAVPPALRAWTPLLAVLFLYTELPMLIRATGHGRFYDQTVISWETAIFGSQPAIRWALRWPSRALSELLHLSYLAYYPIIVSIPALLWFRRRERFAEGTFVLLLTFVACFVCFMAFPVEGPRYLWPGEAPRGPIRDFTMALLEARSSRGTAFPSSHVAVATAQSVLATLYFRRWSAPWWLLTAGLAMGAVYGGFHYAIDVMAGAVFGGLAALAGLELFALIERTSAQANATAPTNPAASAPSDSSTSSSGAAST